MVEAGMGRRWFPCRVHHPITFPVPSCDSLLLRCIPVGFTLPIANTIQRVAAALPLLPLPTHYTIRYTMTYVLVRHIRCCPLHTPFVYTHGTCTLRDLPHTHSCYILLLTDMRTLWYLTHRACPLPPTCLPAVAALPPNALRCRSAALRRTPYHHA